MCIIYRNGGKEICLCEEEEDGLLSGSFTSNVGSIYERVGTLEGLPQQNFFLTFNGRYLDTDAAINSPCAVRLHLRIPGGKGGFGSMLRAIGARIEKTTNREACRDLSGRRMRDVNYEKEMGEWLKQKEKEAENKEEREKNKLKKLDRIINPKHNYEDDGYTANLQTNAEKIDDALKTALHKRDKNLKRKSNGEYVHGKEKKTCGWMGVDNDDDEEEEEEGEIYSDMEEGNVQSAVSDDQPGCSKSSHAVAEGQDSAVAACINSDTTTTKIINPTISTDSSNDSSCSGLDEDIKLLKSTCEEIPAVATSDTSKKVDCGNDVPNRLDSLPESSSNSCVSGGGATGFLGNALIKPLEVVNLADYSSADELTCVGMDVLKFSLTELGLKCGGTLQERAQRLFCTKGVPLDKLDPSLFAKPSKGKNKKQKK